MRLAYKYRNNRQNYSIAIFLVRYKVAPALIRYSPGGANSFRDISSVYPPQRFFQNTFFPLPI